MLSENDSDYSRVHEEDVDVFKTFFSHEECVFKKCCKKYKKPGKKRCKKCPNRF